MPVLEINTNVKIQNPALAELVKEASSTIAKLIGKPEAYVIIQVTVADALSFGGDATTPCAFCRLGSIGMRDCAVL